MVYLMRKPFIDLSKTLKNLNKSVDKSEISG